MAEVIHAPPSAASASALVRGEPGALLQCAVHTAFRGCLIAIGAKAAGMPERDLLRWSMGGALALEVALLLVAASGEKNRRAAGG